MSWHPVATGALADELAAAERAIATDIDSAALDRERPGLRGDAGAALYFGYRALTSERDDDADRAMEHIGGGIDRLATGLAHPSLHEGFAGLAFATQHLSGELFDAEDDPNEDLDHHLLALVTGATWAGGFDIVTGLAGLGIYALERLPRASGSAIADAIIHRLSQVASADGAWLSPTNGHEYGLGLAHGAAGALGFLARAMAAGIAVDVARPLLDRTLSWLLAARHSGADASFGRHSTSSRPDRFAWCHGDPGIASALRVTARAMGDSDVLAVACDIMRNVWQQPPERARVTEPIVCHGAAGLAHMFNRFFHATGDGAFADAARFWLQRTLDLRRSGEGVAGFAAHEIVDGAPAWTSRPGLLAGAAGVGLVLLAATTDVEPAWDRALLLSG